MDSMISKANTARIFYFLVSVFVGFGYLYRVSLIAPGDPVATFDNIVAIGWLFRLTLFSDLLGEVLYILLALAMFRFFKSVNHTHATLMMTFAIISVPIMMLNLVIQCAILLLMGDAPYLQGFDVTQLQKAVLFCMDLLEQGALIGQIFWGLWLFPMGLLIRKCGFFPPWLGVSVIIGGVGYITKCTAHFLLPQFIETIDMVAEIAMYGEVIFVFWFILKGPNLSRLSAQTA